MANEKYEVELDLKINKFKEKIKEAWGVAKDTGQKIANAVRPDIDTSQFQRQLDVLENRLNKLTRRKNKKEVQIEITTKGIADTETLLKRAEEEFDTLLEKHSDLLKDYERFQKLSEKAETKGIDSLTEKENFDLSTYELMNIEKLWEEINDEVAQQDIRVESLKEKIGQQNQKLEEQKEDYIQISKEINNVVRQQSELKSNVFKSTGDSISQAFSKGLKSVKRLTIGFMGARSAFMLFRKYLGEYSRENEEFAQKMQLTTSVITNALAPAFEWFGNVIQYAVIGLARIIELLTGVNILGKAVDNSFKGASKSAKEFNDNLSGLDEISNIQEDSGGLSTGIGSQLNALNEFQKKIAEVDKWLEKTGIKKFFEKLAPIVKNVFGWIAEHPLQTLGLIGGIKLLTSLLPGLLGSAGAGTGLLGLNHVLLGLASIGVIAISVKLIWDASKETKEVENNVTEMAQSLGQQFDNMFENADESLQAFANNSKGMTDTFINNTKTGLDGLVAEYGRMEDKLDKPFTNMIESWFTNTHKVSTNFFQTQVKDVKANVEQMRNAYKNGLLTPEDVQNYKQLLKQIEKETNSLDISTIQKYLGPNSDSVKALKDLKKYINNAMKETDQYLLTTKTDLDKLTNKKYNLNVNVNIDTTGANNSLNNFVSKWQTQLNNKLSLNTGLRLPSYDVGTNYVPRDQIALVHEGERIIPKEYNNSEYLGQMGNSETNMLLMELNRSILEFASREQTFEVNGKELAKVTYGDFQEESSRRGTNTSIRRV